MKENRYLNELVLLDKKKKDKTSNITLTSNILKEEDTREVISITLEFLSDVLSKTLGPYGSTTIIQDRMLNHNMCKDGYTVLKNIMIKEDAPRTILDLVQRISKNLVRKVGDGSTSSIIIANQLFNQLNKIMVTNNIPPKVVLDVLNNLSIVLTDLIKDKSIKIGDDLSALEDIATISTNNDRETGKLIKEIFNRVGKYGFIHVEKSKNENTFVDDTAGFEVHRGYTNSKMATEVDERTCEQKRPYIFMIDSYLGEDDMEVMRDLIGKICLQIGSPLVLLCKGTDTSFDTFVHMNLVKNPNLPLLVVDISVQTKQAKERFDDLAINLGCNPIRRSEGEDLCEDVDLLLPRLGSCEKIISTDTFTRFIKGQGDKNEIQRRLDKIKKLLDDEMIKEGVIDNDETIYELRKRMSLLQNTMSTLYVGGATENEKETKKYLVEDAVFACKSALDFGYILGGNLIVPHLIFKNFDIILEQLKEKNKNNIIKEELLVAIIKAVKESFEYSFESVLNNALLNKEMIKEIIDECEVNYSIYNLITEQYESFQNTSVINSAETDIEIMKSAFSIIGLLVTSNQLIKINYKDIQ